jgi:hypothetical protein
MQPIMCPRQLHRTQYLYMLKWLVCLLLSFLIDFFYSMNNIRVFKTGMVQHVPCQIVPIHVKIVAHARYQIHVHVHLDGETNIVSEKVFM